MTYSEYRKQFDTAEEFLAAFGRLSEKEACRLIAAEPGGTTVKACAMMAWRRAKREAEEADLK